MSTNLKKIDILVEDLTDSYDAMSSNNELARVLMQTAITEHSLSQPLLAPFIHNWGQEAEKIHQDEKYYNIDSYARELWVTTEQFEADLKVQHKGYN